MRGDGRNQVRVSRYSFLGTELYASIASHEGKPQTRKDDLESWLYVMMELLHAKLLPWTLYNLDATLRLKRTFFNGGCESAERRQCAVKNIWNAVPKELRTILEEIKNLDPIKEPKYQ